MKKKCIIIVILVVLLVGGAGTGIWFALGPGAAPVSSSSKVYVESISSVMGLNTSAGMQNRYAGVVEPQKTLAVQLDSSKTVKELLVQEGQEVEVGTPLFIYDVEDQRMSLEQGNLELERIVNSIASLQKEVEDLEKEKKNADKDAQLFYTTEIQNRQMSIKQEEYNKKVKELELVNIQKDIDNAQVTAEMAGVIQKINENPGQNGGYYTDESSQAYITILATGEYRIKGTINEQNMYDIAVGQPVLIRSRVQAGVTWTGTITEIDMGNPQNSGSNSMGVAVGMDGGMQQSSRYPFYIALDSFDGLMLGQHVTIELDQGQLETKEGVWIGDWYAFTEGEQFYVWVAGKKDRIEKRAVTFGDYDEMLGLHQIVDGLSLDDWIAFPEDWIEEGMSITKTMEEAEEPGAEIGGVPE